MKNSNFSAITLPYLTSVLQFKVKQNVPYGSYGTDKMDVVILSITSEHVFSYCNFFLNLLNAHLLPINTKNQN